MRGASLNGSDVVDLHDLDLFLVSVAFEADRRRGSVNCGNCANPASAA
jgi:hypothetical protein